MFRLSVRLISLVVAPDLSLSHVEILEIVKALHFPHVISRQLISSAIALQLHLSWSQPVSCFPMSVDIPKCRVIPCHFFGGACAVSCSTVHNSSLHLAVPSQQ